MTVVSIPSHVPQHLVVDYDIFHLPVSEKLDPQQVWRIFQNKGPLVFSPHNGGHWVATDGHDVFKFFSDPTHFSSRHVSIPAVHEDPPQIPIQMDAPVHMKYRAHIQTLFTPKAIDALEPGIRALTIELIEGFRKNGQCEFISEFALQFPLIVFLRMVNLPLEDRLYLRDIIETFNHSGSEDVKRQAHIKLDDYLAKWVDERIANPGNDWISHVTRGAIDGRPYTKREMISTLNLLLHAGLDTVAMMLAFITYHLAHNPKDREYIRNNHDKMQAILQELFRRFAGPNLGRTLAADYTYKGVEMKKGDRIVLPQSLFNMDETTTPNPDQVDFSRDARHVTFGAGPHTCAGALLARREVTIFLEEWLARIPDFEIIPGKPFKWFASQQNSILEMWVRWPVPASH